MVHQNQNGIRMGHNCFLSMLTYWRENVTTITKNIEALLTASKEGELDINAVHI